MQVWENSILGMAPSSVEEKVFCKICKGDHPTKKYKPKNTMQSSLQLAVDYSSKEENCKVCRKKAHMFTHQKSQKQVASTRVVSCPKFIAGDKAEMKQMTAG